MQTSYLPLPNIWAGGQLFDFSGLEGMTSWSHPTTATTLPKKIGFEFHSGDTKSLRVAVEVNNVLYEVAPKKGHWIVCSDLVDLKVLENKDLLVRVTFIYSQKATIHGRAVVENLAERSPDVRIYLICSSDSATKVVLENNGLAITSHKEKSVLEGNFGGSGLCNSRQAFKKKMFSSLPWTGKPKHKIAFVELLLDRKDAQASQGLFQYRIMSYENAGKAGSIINFDAEYQKKLSYFQRLPKPPTQDVSQLRTYYKAFSVLKANIYVPEGHIKYTWTTPDKYPHRNMWLWDSAFQSIAYKYISGDLGEDVIKAVLSIQADDGYIPLCASPRDLECLEAGARLTQPPTLAWAAWNVYQQTKNKNFLAYCLPRLAKFIGWLFQNRDVNHNGLLEWYVNPRDKICPCGESGMDNSSRFSNGERIDSIDLNALVVNEIRHMALMSKELSQAQDRQLSSRAKRVSHLINEKMWDDRDKFYYDLKLNGQMLRIKSIASFFPLLAKVATPQQAEYLVRHLTDRKEFWSEFPVRTLAQNEPSFDRNMWRGPVWANCNYLIICGLRECGYEDLAREIANKTIQQICLWYDKEGTIFEFYHDLGNSPLKLKRKTEHSGSPSKVLRDYGWSCAVYTELLLSKT